MSTSLPAIPKVAARYVGGHTVLLSPAQGRHFHTDGRERTLRALHTGDEILVPATEVLGLTQYTDPTRVQEPDYFPEFLGVGKVVKPEHRLKDDGTERSLPELQAIGYEFSEGRPDFVPLNVPDVIVPLRTELPSASAGEPEGGAATGPGLILGVHAGALNLARRLPAVAAEVPADAPGLIQQQIIRKHNKEAARLLKAAADEQGTSRTKPRDAILAAAAKPLAADSQEQPAADA